jgi:hypothetical protein
MLFPGVYKGLGNVNLTISSQSLEIRGSGVGAMNNTTPGSSATVIDCERRAFAFFISSVGPFRLSNLSIRNCISSRGGAAVRTSSAFVVLRNLVLDSNRAVGGSNGGAISVISTALELYNITLFNNSVASPGFGGAISVIQASAKVDHPRLFWGNVVGTIDYDDNGQPVFRNPKLANSIGGTVYCANASINVNTTQDVADAIKDIATAQDYASTFNCSQSCSVTYRTPDSKTVDLTPFCSSSAPSSKSALLVLSLLAVFWVA